jgi:hypothetical protein
MERESQSQRMAHFPSHFGPDTGQNSSWSFAKFTGVALGFVAFVPHLKIRIQEIA